MAQDVYRFDRVRVLLSETTPIFNGAVRSVLHGMGFRTFSSFESVAALREEFAATSFDLWITNAELPDGEVFGLIGDLRHGRVGRDMFIPIVVQSLNVTQALAQKTLDSGADLLWRLPVTGGQISDGIDNLVQRRRPFVVTADYIGPDRRATPRAEGMQIPQIPVPNPLRSKAHPEGFKIDAAEATRQISEQKVERVAYQIGWLMERIGPVLSVDPENADARKMLDRLLLMAAELLRRVGSTRYRDRTALCRALLLQARQVSEDPAPRHVDMLAQLVEAERAALTPQAVPAAGTMRRA